MRRIIVSFCCIAMLCLLSPSTGLHGNSASKMIKISNPSSASRPTPQSPSASTTRVTYKSGSLNIVARYFPPQGVGAGRRRPLIVYCHDGVSGLSRESVRFCRLLAGLQYAVLAPSYRGQDGSGGQIEVAKGEVDDVLAAVEFAKNLPGADPARTALVGTSHGALIAALAASRSTGIKALVEGYGVMNILAWWDYLKSHDFRTDDPLSVRVYGKGPEDKPDAFKIRNATEVASKIRCPVLILHGDDDRIVPLDQGIQFNSTLSRLRKDVTFRHYPKAGHGFLVYAPQHGKDPEHQAQKQAVVEIRSFLTRWLR